MGPFFRVLAHTAESVASPPWQAMSELTENPEVLVSRVALVRGLLASGGQQAARVETRVTASSHS